MPMQKPKHGVPTLDGGRIEEDALSRWVDEGGAGSDPMRRPDHDASPSPKYGMRALFGALAATIGTAMLLHRIARRRGRTMFA